ncbi:ferredoxin [Jiangella alba]|uniref:Ferredoxin n=1 Tax=Jiangella alba TaxID=561176 RepID=A0A1H5Q106_9ACTN|nr:ferredoxin [Jiangella alba]SEF18917.1 ferredoxin [Jiangella alba]
MRIDVNEPACVGSGQCALVAEDLFDQDDDGIVIVLADHVAPELEDAARRAAALCPARAIALAE